MNALHWNLRLGPRNGVDLDFKGLEPDKIETLKYRGRFGGIEVFESDRMPPGELSLRDNQNRELARIVGIKV